MGRMQPNQGQGVHHRAEMLLNLDIFGRLAQILNMWAKRLQVDIDV